jgi:hypothetical protein
MLIAAIHSPASSTSNTYNVLYIIIAAIMLVGFAYAGYKWIKGRGVTEAAIQKMLDLHTSLQQLVDANVLQRLSDQDNVLADIRRSMQPNGLDTLELGDMVRRTELAVGRLEGKIDSQAEKLAAHVGAAEVQDKAIWRELAKKVDK